MYGITELFSSWWGALVVLGLILLNFIALAGYWNRFQLDRHLSRLLGEKTELQVYDAGTSMRDRLSFEFFDNASNRIYFLLTMGCALLLISLPLFPIHTRTRFFLWLALTASTLFGIYRLYLSLAGRDIGLRGDASELRTSKDFEESLDQLSESGAPSRLLAKPDWLKEFWIAYTKPIEKRIPVSVIGFILAGLSDLEQNEGSLPADRVSVLVGDAIVRALRDDDLVCQVEMNRYFAALIDCPAARVHSIGDRLTKQINGHLMERASRIYHSSLNLVYVCLEIPDSIRFEDPLHMIESQELLWEALNRQSLRMGTFA